MYRIGIDMGGTKIAAGIVGDDGGIAAQMSVPTGEPDALRIAETTTDLIRRILARSGVSEKEISSIGIGVPGTADQETGMIEYANNLGMENVPFLELLQPCFPHTPMALENDANAAAYAEYLFGAGRGCRSMVMITLGTGIGAGIILNGSLYEGINYAAGELGHMVIEVDGRPCNCGRRGCFEQYASSLALVAAAQAAMSEAPESLLWELCRGDSSLMDGKLFFEAVRRCDAAALHVLGRYTEYLAIGIIDVVNFIQPELVVIGGGISREGELLLAPVRERMASVGYARLSRHQTRLESALLGNDAGIIGAAFLADHRRAGRGEIS